VGRVGGGRMGNGLTAEQPTWFVPLYLLGDGIFCNELLWKIILFFQMVSTTLTNAWVVVNGGGGSVEGGVEED